MHQNTFIKEHTKSYKIMTIVCEKVYQMVRYIKLTSHIKKKSICHYEIKLYKNYNVHVSHNLSYQNGLLMN